MKKKLELHNEKIEKHERICRKRNKDTIPDAVEIINYREAESEKMIIGFYVAANRRVTLNANPKS